ncbi:hypothetical protein GS506_12885 [Rhodococcus hoagii]|nr:hypothetical protein [Prescottella equi]
MNAAADFTRLLEPLDTRNSNTRYTLHTRKIITALAAGSVLFVAGCSADGDTAQPLTSGGAGESTTITTPTATLRSEPAANTAATARPTTANASAPVATTEPAAIVETTTPTGYATIMRSDGATQDQIESVEVYRQMGCALLAENPSLRAKWSAAMIRSEILESYEVTLSPEAANAVLRSC